MILPSGFALGATAFCGLSTLYLIYEVGSSGSLVLTECAWLTAFSTAVLLIATVGVSFSRERPRSSRYTYGYNRIPVLSVFAATALIQLSSVFLLKECIESLLDLDHHHGSHDSSYEVVIGGILVLACTVLAAYAIPHNPFNHVLAAASSSIVQEHAADLSHALCTVVPGLSRVLLPRINALTLLGSLSAFSCILAYQLGETYHWIDPVAAVLLALSAFSTMMPLSSYTGLILLQTVPAHVRNQIDRCVAEARTVDGVLEVRETHFWQIDFNQIAGSVDVRIRKDANEQVVLAAVTERLSGLVNFLSVQVLKDVTTSWSRPHEFPTTHGAGHSQYSLPSQYSMPPMTKMPTHLYPVDVHDHHH